MLNVVLLVNPLTVKFSDAHVPMCSSMVTSLVHFFSLRICDGRKICHQNKIEKSDLAMQEYFITKAMPIDNIIESMQVSYKETEKQ